MDKEAAGLVKNQVGDALPSHGWPAQRRGGGPAIGVGDEDFCCFDGLDGRAAARRLGLAVIGTIGILEKMAEAGFIDLPTTVTMLGQTNFFVSPDLLDAALARDRQRHAP